MMFANTSIKPDMSECITSITEWDNNLGINRVNGLFADNRVLTYVAQPPKTLVSFNKMFENYLGASSGGLPEWDTSHVTSFSDMFKFSSAFNGNVSNWNVSNVTNMNSMFYGAQSFNSDLSQWNVSNVTTMNSVFYGAFLFKSNLSSWDVCSTAATNPGVTERTSRPTKTNWLYNNKLVAADLPNFACV